MNANEILDSENAKVLFKRLLLRIKQSDKIDLNKSNSNSKDNSEILISNENSDFDYNSSTISNSTHNHSVVNYNDISEVEKTKFDEMQKEIDSLKSSITVLKRNQNTPHRHVKKYEVEIKSDELNKLNELKTVEEQIQKLERLHEIYKRQAPEHSGHLTRIRRKIDTSKVKLEELKVKINSNNKKKKN
jgi:hypothetical protein